MNNDAKVGENISNEKIIVMYNTSTIIFPHYSAGGIYLHTIVYLGVTHSMSLYLAVAIYTAVLQVQKSFNDNVGMHHAKDWTIAQSCVTLCLNIMFYAGRS